MSPGSIEPGRAVWVNDRRSALKAKRGHQHLRQPRDLEEADIPAGERSGAGCWRISRFIVSGVGAFRTTSRRTRSDAEQPPPRR